MDAIIGFDEPLFRVQPDVVLDGGEELFHAWGGADGVSVSVPSQATRETDGLSTEEPPNAAEGADDEADAGEDDEVFILPCAVLREVDWAVDEAAADGSTDDDHESALDIEDGVQPGLGRSVVCQLCRKARVENAETTGK